VLDAETLRNSDRELSRAAMDLVKSTSFQASGFQQEAFINAQFHMPGNKIRWCAYVPHFRAFGDSGPPWQSFSASTASCWELGDPRR
jgi:hypothetical protein